MGKKIIITILVLAVIVLFFLWLRWNKCEKGCPEPGMLMPCVPKKCKFWTGKPESLEKESEDTTENTEEPKYEAGKTYTDSATGGEIVCYSRQSGKEPLAAIFKAQAEGGAKGTLYKKTDSVACYLFPKKNNIGVGTGTKIN